MATAAIFEDGTYLRNNPTWHEEDSPWKARQIATILSNNNIRPLTICEIGCGTGEILARLAGLYGTTVTMTGYEISPQAFERCRKKETPHLHFCYGDLFDEKEASFDVAMAIDVFEHVEDYFSLLRAFRTKGTYKVFHIPLDLSVQMVLRSAPILRGRRLLGHIHYFSKETALATLNDTGYEVIDYFYTRGSLELPNRGWKANIMNLPRRLAFRVHKDIAVRLLGGFSLLVLAK